MGYFGRAKKHVTKKPTSSSNKMVIDFTKDKKAYEKEFKLGKGTVKITRKPIELKYKCISCGKEISKEEIYRSKDDNYDLGTGNYRCKDCAKEFNLKGRLVRCLHCSKLYTAKAKIGCCSEECKKLRKKEKEEKYNKNNRDSIRKSISKYAQRNKKKINVKAIANYHIKIFKGQICEFKDCKDLAKEKHHEDYDKPFAVRFYCRKHHKFIHRRKDD